MPFRHPLFDPRKPVWEPLPPFRFDPTRPDGRRAVAAAVAVWRLRAAGEPVPPELENACVAAVLRASRQGRVRKSAYAERWASYREIDRVATTAAGCARLAAAIVARERSSP